jgi:type I site-specific restriction endonuclease
MRLSSSSSPSAAEGRINKPNPTHTHTTSQTANQIDQTANQINRINQPASQPARSLDNQPDNNNMRLRLWKKETDLSQLKARLKRLECSRKDFTTLTDVIKLWDNMASGNGMLRRITAQENWRKETNAVLLEIMKDITIIERKLNGLCPLASDLEAMSGRTTSESCQSTSTVEQDYGSSNAPPSPLSPESVSSTFTKRKGNGIERTALETDGLRLSPTGSGARKGRPDMGSKR